MKQNPPRILTVALPVLAIGVLTLAFGWPQFRAHAQAAAPGPYRIYLSDVHSAPPYPPPVMLQRLAEAEAHYPAIVGQPAGSCALCHRGAPPPPNYQPGQYNLNNYGFDFQDSNYKFTSVESIDSDGDGYRNIDELNAGSNPGDKASWPGVIPTGTPPPAPTGTPPPAAANQLSNPGFESWSGAAPAGWSVSGGGSAGASTDAHSGSRSILLNAANGTALIESNFFRVQPDQVVDASMWVKWQGLSGNIYNGEGLRMDLYVYDSSQATVVHRFFSADVDGSFGQWRHMSNLGLMPANAAWARLRIQIVTSAGTATVDDAYAGIAQSLPAVDTSTAGPVIVPHPWQIKNAGSTKLSLGNTAIVHPTSEDRLHAAVESFYNGTGVSHTYLNPGDASAANYNTLLRFGDRNTPDVAAAFAAKFPANTWDQLGSQGYFLSVQKPGGQLQILAGANSEQGRFYALQSLKQIVKSGQIYPLDVLDAPTVPVRGIIMSSARYNNYSANLQKFAGLKMNFAWNQGTFMNDKFNYNWKTALTSAELSDLAGYISAARANFVSPWISIGPRASGGPGANTPCYGCDADINLVVQKFDALYGVGLRNFGLNFDDLNNVGQQTLYWQSDKTQFGNDLAQAHKYFITQVYNRLKALHADSNMMVIPFSCYLAANFAPSQDHYLQVLSGMPAAIGLYSVQYFNDDYLRTMQLAGRPTLNWSNFYAEGYLPSATYIAPHYNFFDPFNSAVRSAVSGLTYLPLQPGEEDAGEISQYTTADYFWAPDRYNPNQSFQWGVAKHQGK